MTCKDCKEAFEHGQSVAFQAVTTEVLVDELSKREGVKRIVLTAGNIWGSVERRGMGSDWVERTPVVSPATILVIRK